MRIFAEGAMAQQLSPDSTTIVRSLNILPLSLPSSSPNHPPSDPNLQQGPVPGKMHLSRTSREKNRTGQDIHPL